MDASHCPFRRATDYENAAALPPPTQEVARQPSDRARAGPAPGDRGSSERRFRPGSAPARDRHGHRVIRSATRSASVMHCCVRPHRMMALVFVCVSATKPVAVNRPRMENCHRMPSVVPTA